MFRAIVIAAVLLTPVNAGADEATSTAPASTTPPAYPRLPLLTLPEPRLVCIPAVPVERCRELPPGRFLDEPAYQAVDVEMKSLQTAKTRLEAENKSLRASADGWQPGWRTMVLTFATGLAGGLWLYSKI